MIAKLSDLGWPEVRLHNVEYSGSEMRFRALDLIEIGIYLKYEIVNIRIQDIEALRVEIIPYRNDHYDEPELPVSFGRLEAEPEGFECIMYGNPFTQTTAEYFWVSVDLKAKNIEVERTAQYEAVPRPT